MKELSAGMVRTITVTQLLMLVASAAVGLSFYQALGRVSLCGLIACGLGLQILYANATTGDTQLSLRELCGRVLFFGGTVTIILGILSKAVE
jgi:hypothetical protein